MKNNYTLPKDWKWVKLGDVGKIETGTTPSKSNAEYYGKEIPFFKPTDLQQGINTITASDNLSKLGFEKTRKLPKDSILVTCIGATIGKTGLIKVEGASNQQINSIIPDKQHNSKFVFYQVISHSFQNQIKDNSSSTTLPILNKSKFQQLDFITTTFDSQQAIVSKIEELFSELDKGIENLRTAQQQLKTYRQSVLKWAFEGKLTNENVRDGELPKGWKWLTMNDVTNKIGDIDHKMPQQLSSGYPYVSTKDFTDDLKISFDRAKYISKEDYLNLSRKIKPEKGDIIFPRYGTIGKNILVDFDKKFLVSYSCAVVKPNNELVLSKYLYLYSLSPKITDEIRKYVVETTQANIGIASIKSFVFPLPPIEEQNNVVQEIESRLSVADKMEESITQSLQQAEALRQSILKKAFEGRLV